MSERKLATIRKIDKISPIEGADRIERVTIGGWNVVSQKDLYKEGDLVIYCEIDSFIPTEIAPFLTQEGQNPKEYNGVRGERLRSKKLRGVISQGLLLPLTCIRNEDISVLNGPYPIIDGLNDMLFVLGKEEGEKEISKIDFTELLGIQKFEPPIPACLAGEVIGMFPSFIPKTNEERIQNLRIEDFKEDYFHITEKLDGTSCTIYFKDDKIGVCSRNLELKEREGNTLWAIARKHDLENKLRELAELGHNLAIQGEVIGEGIQKNPYKIKGQELRVFNIYDITSGEFVSHNNVLELCDKLNLLSVPVISNELITLDKMTIEEVLAFAEGKSALNSGQEREGIVFKTPNRLKSFKAISNRFLAKEKD